MFWVKLSPKSHDVSLEEEGEGTWDTERRREGGQLHREADAGVTLPQDEESQEPLRAGGGKKDFPLGSADRVRVHFCCFKLPNL